MVNCTGTMYYQRMKHLTLKTKRAINFPPGFNGILSDGAERDNEYSFFLSIEAAIFTRRALSSA